MATLKFATFSSDIELPFYTSLASHKINHDKLDDSSRRLLGLYEIRPEEDAGISCRMQLHGNALTNDEVPSGYYRAEGLIRNVNTIEDYRNIDKTEILHRAGRMIWDSILDGTIYECPSRLASFSAICFADLKKYKFTYHFAFPALHPWSPWKVVSSTNVDTDHPGEGSTSLGTRLSTAESTALVDSVQTWRYRVDARQYGFFLAKKVRTRSDGEPQDFEASPPLTPDIPGSKLDFTWEIGSIGSFDNDFFKDTDFEDRFICFADPSTYPDNPGWMLRNYLVLVNERWKLSDVQILCYRDVQARRYEGRSVVFRVKVDNTSPKDAESTEIPSASSSMPKVTGWERNSAGKVASKITNLGEYMDPQRLADQAVDLNLKLIKWRIAPRLDLDIIKETKCLLLGAGTLGSYVARNLLGWGIRKITFVDNGSVSYSNPVRQPLFDFKDCLAGGARKAQRAAEALTEIYPGVVSEGHVISVPMAGHPILDEHRVKSDFDTLKRLVEEHDVIFLLMDTRESRWLPTVMGKSAGKLVMNAALGFDSFVVMRHGVRDTADPGKELGCYFCNDVVAPADSMSDRTLDQQCTVTRPGVAAIASALLVETMISVLQHEDMARAPAPLPNTTDHGEHPLGAVPHQIRGFLSNYQNILVSGKSYDCCSACSPKVVDAYAEQGWDFVQRALNEKDFVESLSGLKEVQKVAEEAAEDVDWDSDES